MELKELKDTIKKTFIKYFDRDEYELIYIKERLIVYGSYHIEYIGVDKVRGVFVNFTISSDYGAFNANSTDNLLANPIMCRCWLNFIEELKEVLKENR